MVDLLDHPVQPLKAVLKELADYDKSARVYKLKQALRFWDTLSPAWAGFLIRIID